MPPVVDANTHYVTNDRRASLPTQEADVTDVGGEATKTNACC
jgi:hypothetical protein